MEDDHTSTGFKGKLQEQRDAQTSALNKGKGQQRPTVMGAGQCDMGLAVLSTCAAHKAHQQSVTTPAQLKVTMRHQPFRVLVLKDMSSLNPHRSPGGACKLCAWGLQALSWVEGEEPLGTASKT